MTFSSTGKQAWDDWPLDIPRQPLEEQNYVRDARLTHHEAATYFSGGAGGRRAVPIRRRSVRTLHHHGRRKPIHLPSARGPCKRRGGLARGCALGRARLAESRDVDIDPIIISTPYSKIIIMMAIYYFHQSYD